MTAKEMIDEIVALPVEDRIAVAETVLRSLNVPDSEHDTEWAAVVNRRLRDIREERESGLGTEFATDIFRSIDRAIAFPTGWSEIVPGIRRCQTQMIGLWRQRSSWATCPRISVVPFGMI